MIPTRRSAWGTVSSYSPAGPGKSRLKSLWTCLGLARSLIQSWLSSRPESWPNWKKERKNELHEIDEDLCRGLLRFPAGQLAVALQFRGDSGLSISLAQASRGSLVGNGDRRSALAQYQGHLDSNGDRVRGRGYHWPAHWSLDGDEPTGQ